MSVMSHMEMDPCSQPAWLDRVLEASKLPGAPDLLELFKTTDKEQQGGFTDDPVCANTYNTVVAPPQAGKTQGIMLAAMEAGYDSGILTVMSVMNSRLEAPRYRATANRLNGIVTTIAEKMGIRPENVPSLRIFDEGSAITYRTALDAWSHGSNVIPVFVVMMNNTKFNKFQLDHLQTIVRAVERDGKGRPKIMLLTDEADLQFKTSSNTSQLERSIFARKVTIGAESFENLQGVFTTITSVTATPQAIVAGQVDFGGRRPVLYEPQPSKSNFQYHSNPKWSNKLITRATADDAQDMYKDMMEGDQNRYALVYASDTSTTAMRSSAAHAAAKELSGKARGVVTFAWASGKIEVFTSDAGWVRFFRGAEQGLFTQQHVDGGVTKFTGRKSVNSYPSVIHYMATRSNDSIPCKFVLFAKEMADRAIPVKGTGHEWPLTDMMIKAPKASQESRVQVCGRLCGIDVVGAVKTLWCSKKEHDVHKKAIDRIQFIVDVLLREGMSALDAIAKTRKTLVDLTDDTPVVSDIIVDEESAIDQLGGAGITRPGAGKRMRKMAVDTTTMARDMKVKLSSEVYESGLVHSEMTPSSSSSGASGASDDVTDDVTDGSVDDTNTTTQMREIMEGESGAGVMSAIKEVVRDNDGAVDFDRVPTDMASREPYPDGCSFSPSALLKLIVREKMGLLTANGIQFVDGAFSLV